MKHTFCSPCPVETTLNLIGNKWKFLIIRDLLTGKKRFMELKKSISATKNQDISQNILTQNLRELEEAQILTRTIYPQVPPESRIFSHPTRGKPKARFGESRPLGRSL